MLKLVATEAIPQYAVCYIEYGDATGLEEEDIEATDKFLANYPGAVFDYKEGTEGFCAYPAFGLACDCIETDIYQDI